MHFMRKKRDPHRNLAFMINIRGWGIEVKKIKLSMLEV